MSRKTRKGTGVHPDKPAAESIDAVAASHSVETAEGDGLRPEESTNGSQPFKRASAYHVAQQQLAAVADVMGLDDDLAEYLRVPHRDLSVHFPVRMDDGRLRIFEGFRVHHNTAKGPTKGGIRYHPEVTLDECRALAMWMTWKTSLMDLPYGGAKGGVVVDPKQLSLGELERMSRRFATEISEFIGPEKDIPAPDVGTNAQVMAWMMDTYSMHKGYSVPAVITGKPVSIGGTVGREYATGLGVTYVVRAVLEQRMGVGLDNTTVAIQGFGNVGSWTARSMSERGAYVVAVSDVGGGIYNPEGLDLRQLLRYATETGHVQGFPGTEEITNAELLELDVDVLVPAALEGQITSANANDVRARMIAEAANGPVSPEADAILEDKGVLIIPDILCNAGGVVVSYFEWVQGLQSYFWDESEIRRLMQKKLLSNLSTVNGAMTRRGCSMRMAAYIIAVERVIEAIRMRGFYP